MKHNFLHWIREVMGSNNEIAHYSIPPKNFFNNIKKARNIITETELHNIYYKMYDICAGFIVTGQYNSADKVVFHLKNIRREQEAIRNGFNMFVYRDDLDDYMDKVSSDVVKITELSNYERVIPSEAKKLIAKAKPIFDELYIVFTDYTGKEERKIEQYKREKDPIVFGVFKSDDNYIWNHRFYFITDWIDQYCDLTLDKFIGEMANANKSNINYKNPIHEANTHKTVEELEAKIKELKTKGRG